jgi:hypothetical protein
MAGIGQSPSYYQSGIQIREDQNYWAIFPLTIPFRDNTISWDILPGVLYDTDYGENEDTAWGFSYSTRLAVYKIIPQSSIVTEVFGVTGDVESEAQYKAGVRWKSKYLIAALTYGDGLEGNDGASIEFGIIVLTPPFF